ncbi:MAG: hypothetical protein LBB55_07340 [Zoogloeaceae bacterium]|nr:hypothetical protein [Zoogloeaceae bacterium]
MFTWLNKQGVRSDTGFEVQFTGRFSAEYREDGMSDGMPCIILDPLAFAYWSDGASISQEKQVQMLQNFKEAMTFQGLKTVVEEAMTVPCNCLIP